jgi:CRISPR-associated protein Cas1
MRDLHELPRLRDSVSYLYVEHAILNQKQKAIELFREEGTARVPIADLSVLFLGPGTSITHSAVKALADSGCTIVWTGEEGTRFYAQGTGETRRAYHLLRQAEQAADPARRMNVVTRMYRYRFAEELPLDLSLPQVRGMEGVRVRQAYAQAARRYGVEWSGRRYDRFNWGGGDPINRALSAANALLNGLCHAAIVSGGYSAGLGFIHTGKQLSFVYDIADLYKVDVTIPLAFQAVAESPLHAEKTVRQLCRERFREVRLLERVLPDIDTLLQVDRAADEGEEWSSGVDVDPALPGPYWSPDETGG